MPAHCQLSWPSLHGYSLLHHQVTNTNQKSLDLMATTTDNRTDLNAAWRYEKELPADGEDLEMAWKLLETYSDIPPDQVAEHITAIVGDNALSLSAVAPVPIVDR